MPPNLAARAGGDRARGCCPKNVQSCPISHVHVSSVRLKVLLVGCDADRRVKLEFEEQKHQRPQPWNQCCWQKAAEGRDPLAEPRGNQE